MATKGYSTFPKFPLDYLMSYPGYSLWGLTPWYKCHIKDTRYGVLLHDVNAVGVFYSPSRLGLRVRVMKGYSTFSKIRDWSLTTRHILFSYLRHEYKYACVCVCCLHTLSFLRLKNVEHLLLTQKSRLNTRYWILSYHFIQPNEIITCASSVRHQTVSCYFIL